MKRTVIVGAAVAATQVARRREHDPRNREADTEPGLGAARSSRNNVRNAKTAALRKQMATRIAAQAAKKRVARAGQ